MNKDANADQVEGPFSRWSGFGCLLVMLGPLVPLGLFLGVLGSYHITRSFLVDRKTTCTVLSGKLILVTKEYDRAGRYHYPTYRPEFTLAYDVDGHRLVSTGYSPSSIASGFVHYEQSILSRYPAGSRVGCWYDPAEPTKVVLVRFEGFSMVFFCVVPFLVAAGTVWFLRMAFGLSFESPEAPGPAVAQPDESAKPVEAGRGLVGCGVAYFLWMWFVCWLIQRSWIEWRMNGTFYPLATGLFFFVGSAWFPVQAALQRLFGTTGSRTDPTQLA